MRPDENRNKRKIIDCMIMCSNLFQIMRDLFFPERPLTFMRDHVSCPCSSFLAGPSCHAAKCGKRAARHGVPSPEALHRHTFSGVEGEASRLLLPESAVSPKWVLLQLTVLLPLSWKPTQKIHREDESHSVKSEQQISGGSPERRRPAVNGGRGSSVSLPAGIPVNGGAA